MSWHRQRGAPVDCHVLAYDCPQWKDQALASLEDQPCNIWLEEGNWGGHIGRARAYSLAQGNAPYQMWLDDDDWLLPGEHVQACIDTLESNPGLVGVYTDYQHIDPASDTVIRTTDRPDWSPLRQLRNPFEILHLKVFRRAAARPYLPELHNWPTLEEAVLMGLLVHAGDWQKLHRVAYAKRRRFNGAGSRITEDLIRRGVARYAPALIARQRALRQATPLPERSAAPGGL